jgi:cytochrome d ubiquinol oxidase subunit I
MFTLATSSQLLPAREQMALTLGFHIVLACMGVAFPAITLVANWWGLRKGDETALTLARRWSKVMAVLFAVGAVTGTVLSFELGLLWPKFMARFGDAFGIPFAIEGIFFFTEAIFIALYIYGWDRLKGWAHFWTGVPIVISGIGGAFAVITANSWMNQPGGFELDAAGKVTSVDPGAVIFNHAAAYEVPHMILAAFMVGGFLVASVYAAGMLKGRRDRHHRLGFAIPFTIAAIATPIQFFVGDTAARSIAHDQPSKFASMEYVLHTGPDQTEYIGGVLVDGKVKGGIGIPDLDSILVGFSPDTVVHGLDQVPHKDRPPSPTLLHLSFDAMVGIATALIALCGWYALRWVRRRALPESIWFWRAASVAGVAAVIALECGWIVTEVGRQPWIVYGVMRTDEAVTGAQGIWFSLAAVVVLYAALAVGTIIALRAMARRWREGEQVEGGLPYGSPPVAVAAEPEREGEGS